MIPEERAAKVAAALDAGEDRLAIIAEAIRAAVADERARCARIAATEPLPEDSLPLRYWLQALLRPNRLARDLIRAVRWSIADRIRRTR